MRKLPFVGLALITAVTPIAVVVGSSPARADPQSGDLCSVKGEIWRAADGMVLVCDYPAHGAPLAWMWTSGPTS